MLENNIDDLCKCWEAMNNKLKLQLGHIRAYFQKSFHEVYHTHTSPFYGNLRGSISRDVLRCVAGEFLRVDYVGTNTQICRCTLRTSCVFLCACELARYILGGDPIPINVVHIH